MDSVDDHNLETVATFLKGRSAYDLLPISSKVILLDSHLPVKKALAALIQNGLGYAPLWDSKRQVYFGILLASDFLHLINYFYAQTNSSFPKLLEELDSLTVEQINEHCKIQSGEKPTVQPDDSLYICAQVILQANGHLVPVIDYTLASHPTVVSVITQYRLLKFVSVNYHRSHLLNLSLKDIKLGTYQNLATCQLSTKVIDIVQLFLKRKIAAIPVVAQGTDIVLNIFDANDVLTLLKTGDFLALDRTVADALTNRCETFEGVHKCQETDTLQSVLNTIHRETVSRLIVVTPEDRLVGILTLSDILKYLLKQK